VGFGWYYRNYLSVNGVVVVGTGSRRCANIVAVDEDRWWGGVVVLVLL
jgi:hypothetical protein